jgi:exopolysaccharide production protein ExoY
MASYPPELGHGNDTPTKAGAADGSVVTPAELARPATQPSSPRLNGHETRQSEKLHNNGGAWISTAGRARRKRALDLGLTLLALPAVGLLCLVISLVVAVTSRGPVLFLQERVGLGGQRFRLVKFRTMHVNAESQLRSDPELWDEYVRNDFKLPASSETRVTPVGRFLRRSSLDELPQLLNVLRGHMSLVGPRPIVPDELEMYGTDKAAYLSVRPGITGTWQVNGRSGVGYPDRTALDREYAESWTLRKDMGILLQTPLAVLSSRGAH